MADLDPYLRLAKETGFRDYVPAYDDSTPLDFLLELADGGAEKLCALASLKADVLVNVAHLPTESCSKPPAKGCFVTARMPLAALDELIRDKAVLAVELAETLRHQRTRLPKTYPFPDALREGDVLKVRRSSTTLAAIIDDGCPFAHAEFRKAGGGTRVVALWDMDPCPEFEHVDPRPESGKAVAGAPAGFFRGREVPGSKLDQWMSEATTDGVLHEELCYTKAKYSTVLQASLTHGSHLLGLLAGKRYARGKEKCDAASQADIAFLQIPRRAVEAPDGGSMHACILDALRYLRRLAAVNGYERCVVTCAMGSMLGPHDGTSLFERALDAILDEKGIPFTIVFAAGNADDQRLHAVMSPKIPMAPEGKHEAAVLWMLPGGNESAAFAELWVGAGANESFTFVAEGQAQTIPAGTPAWIGRGLLALHTPGRLTLRAAPTRCWEGEGTGAQPGCARIGVQWKGNVDVHGYVAWGGENLGCTRRTVQTEWRAPSDSRNTRVHDCGTLLGDVCGGSDSIVVAGGYVGANNEALRIRARYSGVGPTRARHRGGPKYLGKSDESAAVQGVPGPGTRSNHVEEYVWGTSVAAPQVARALINVEKMPERSRSGRQRPMREIGHGLLAEPKEAQAAQPPGSVTC